MLTFSYITVLVTLPLANAWLVRDVYNTLTSDNSSAFAACLSSNATIHFPSQPDYNETTVQRYSTWEEPDFTVTIKPACSTDVQCVIRTCNQNNLTFFATGGAHHGGVGFGAIKHAVNIDLSGLTAKEIDGASDRLTIGPANSFVDFESDLYALGKVIPTGNEFCVNMIGATIGAGVGPYQGLYGLSIDALRSVQLVTATGDLITASTSQNSDLFWAIRGAGANFGVITSATYQIYDAPNQGNLIAASFAYAGSNNASVWKLVESWERTYPKEMGLTVTASYDRSSSTASLTASMSYFGAQNEAQPWIDQLVAVGPTRWTNSSIPWSNASAAQSFGNGAVACQRGLYNNDFSTGATRVDSTTATSVFDKFIAFSASRPWYNGVFFMQRFNLSATLAVPLQSRGVYPGRNFAALYVFENYYDGPEHDADVFSSIRSLRAELATTSGFKELQTYINYAFGDEGPEIWYGKHNLPRLVGLKQRWDPQGKFGPGNPVPLSLS